MNKRKYQVEYPLIGEKYECRYFATFEEAVKEYIKRVTPIDESCWNEARFVDTHIAKWSEKDGKYIRLK